MMKKCLVALLSAASIVHRVSCARAGRRDPDLPPDHAGKAGTRKPSCGSATSRSCSCAGSPLPGPRSARARDPRSAGRRKPPTPSSTRPSGPQIGPAPIPVGGGNGGRTVAIAVHPTNPDIVYVGAAQAACTRSLDGGVNWTPIFDSALTLAIGALTLAPRTRRSSTWARARPNGSADSFFGVGLYRIRQRQHDRGPGRSHQPAGDDGRPRDHRVHRARHQRDPRCIHGPERDLRCRRSQAPAASPSGGSVGFTVPPLAMRGIYRSNQRHRQPDLHQADGDGGGQHPAGHQRRRHHLGHRDGPEQPNVIVAWVLGSAATLNSGGIYRTTNALAATPTFTQLVTTPHHRGARELTANFVGGVTRMWAATGETASAGRAAALDRRRRDLVRALDGRRGLLQPAVLLRRRGRRPSTTQANTVMLAGSPSPGERASTDEGDTFAAVRERRFTSTATCTPSRPPTRPSCTSARTRRDLALSATQGRTWTSRNNTQYYRDAVQSLSAPPVRPRVHDRRHAGQRHRVQAARRELGAHGRRRRRLRAHRPERTERHERHAVPHVLQQRDARSASRGGSPRPRRSEDGQIFGCERHGEQDRLQPDRGALCAPARPWGPASRTRSTTARTRSTAPRQPGRSTAGRGQPVLQLRRGLHDHRDLASQTTASASRACATARCSR